MKTCSRLGRAVFETPQIGVGRGAFCDAHAKLPGLQSRTDATLIDHPTSLGLLLIQGALLSQRGDRDGAWNSCNRDLGAQLVRNIAPKNGHWTQVRLEETSRASTLGATLSAKADDHTMCRQVRTAESYCAASDPRIHFGLGQSKSLTSIQVTWSDGQIDSLDALVSDNIHTLRWGEGRE